MNANSDGFQAYRQRVYDTLPLRADALLDLLDSLSANLHAKSVAELSLGPLFKRKYSSLYDGIEHYLEEGDAQSQRRHRERLYQEMLAEFLPRPDKRPFWLLGIDTTGIERRFARTVSDRSVIYHPNPAPGNKPIGVGHSYSFLALLPERETWEAPWVVPLSSERVPTDKGAKEIAQGQVERLLGNEKLPFAGELTVEVLDSHYSHAPYLSPVGKHANHVVVSRLASNRKLFHLPPAVQTNRQAHPTWHGARFKLNAPDTWGEPDEETQVEWRTHQGRVWQVRLQRWNDLLMAGKRDAPMHQRPFDLIRCQAVNEEGKPVFKHTLWLLVMGQRRREVRLLQAYEAYRQRYDLEHFFRFGKNHLLLDRYQTPEVEYEENWVELVCLAYIQLWLTRSLAVSLPRPWERYLPDRREREKLGPSEVQRDLGRIIREFGTPAQAPKPRGNSGGRRKGQSPGVRTRQPIVFKSRAPPQTAV